MGARHQQPAKKCPAAHETSKAPAPASPGPAGAAAQYARILGVQRSAGNAAVGALLRAGLARAKLRVGAADDPLEREADRAADRFVRGGRDAGPAEAPGCECGGACEACRAAALPELRRSASPPAPAADLAGVREQVARDVGPGRPIEPATLAEFESHFGRDFAAVRIHDGPRAQRAARSVGARAFAQGTTIAFDAGEFAPETPAGAHLLAHELAHVAQGDNAAAPAIRRAPDEVTPPAAGPAPAEATTAVTLERVRAALAAGDWDVDSLAAHLSDAALAGLDAATRLDLIRTIGGGYRVDDEDETTILRLLRTTPTDQAAPVVRGLTPDLLKTLNSAIDGDNFKQFHEQLRDLTFRALTPEQAAILVEGAKVFPWADPGAIAAMTTQRVIYDDMEINSQGKIIVAYYPLAPFFPLRMESFASVFTMKIGPVELDPHEIIGVYFLAPEEYAGVAEGRTLFMPAVNLLNLYNKQFNQQLAVALDVSLMIGGGAGLVGAAPRVAKLVAALDLAFGAANLGIREYRSQIARSPEGKRFLKAWDVAQAMIAVYGLYRVLRAVPAVIKNVRDGYRGFRATATPETPPPGKLDDQIEQVLKSADEAEAAAKASDEAAAGGTSTADDAAQVSTARPGEVPSEPNRSVTAPEPNQSVMPEPATPAPEAPNQSLSKVDQSPAVGVLGPSKSPIVRIIETDGDVFELAATTAKGDIIIVTGMTKEGDTLILRGMHIDGPGAGSLGIRELRTLARELGRQQGAKRVTIYGGTRTTGANPGHTPRPITFPVGD